MKPARVLELGSYHAIVACVAAGAGVAVAPHSVLELQPHTDNVAAHTIVEFEGIDTLLAWRHGYASAALAALRDALAEGARRPVDAGAAAVAVRSEAGKRRAAFAGLGWAWPNRIKSSRAEPAGRTESNRAGTSRTTGPDRIEPNRGAPGRAESSEPSRIAPGRIEPGRTEPYQA